MSLVRWMVTALLLVGATSACSGEADVTTPTGRTVTLDPSDGPPGCAEWAAHPPTPEERAEGCVGDNADTYLDAVAAVSSCDGWLQRTVSQRDVDRGCRAGPVDLAVTADMHCTDGRTLFWNQAVWGFVGEPAREYAPGADHELPDAERGMCLGG